MKQHFYRRHPNKLSTTLILLITSVSNSFLQVFITSIKQDYLLI